MRESCAPRKAPLRRPERLASSGRFAWVLLLAPLLLLPTSSDACGDPPGFATMKPQGALKPSYSPGEQIQYGCLLGFQPITPGQVLALVCQDDNTWSSLQEGCKRRRCPTLADPINGQVIFVNGSIEFGSQVHYVCNNGYYLLGTSIAYCELSATGVDWSDNPPTCEKILCQPPQEIQNGKYTNSHKEVFEYNEVVTYSCDPSNGPDEYSLVGESKLTCIGNDEWSSQPPQCKVVKCVYPAIEHGTIVSGFGPKYYYKATVVLKCNEGFNLHGNSIVVCGETSTWEPELPKCIKVLIPSSTHSPIPSTQPPVPSTQPPVPSVSVSTRSTQHPVPSVSGHPPRPTDASPPSGAEGLGAGYIVLIIVALLALDYCSACTAVFADKGRKGNQNVTVHTVLFPYRKAECSATYTTYQDKAATPTE
ncbi:membrane cofactor protein isoform X1 [Bubalus kerabau]|uniref:membrane cofactor protein isoform X1 n=2 Tax=Bubalus carabanensis TaxID=3119969 RepID=UPI00244EFCB5|nr:membrane cofactor protein isoform X1 [Bubalus carabanensis]